MLDLNSLMVASDDPKALSDFYARVLGKAAFEDNAYTGWQLGSAWLMVGPHSEVKGRNEMPGRIMWNFETEDVKGEFERIKGLGVTVVQEPYDPDPSGSSQMLMATFEDPDGNYFQLASPMQAP